MVTTRYNLLNHKLTSTEMSTRYALIETGVPGWKPPQRPPPNVARESAEEGCETL